MLAFSNPCFDQSSIYRAFRQTRNVLRETICDKKGRSGAGGEALHVRMDGVFKKVTQRKNVRWNEERADVDEKQSYLRSSCVQIYTCFDTVPVIGHTTREIPLRFH